MPNRIIAIGDIHGCAEALCALLEVVDPDSEDQVITLGDYVDRGPNTRDVITQLIELSKRCQHIALVGNHELMMLDAIRSNDPTALEFWLVNGGEETLISYGDPKDGIPVAHLEFMMSCHRYHEIDTHIFVHANYAPNCSLEQQTDHTLLWQHLSQPPEPHTSGKVVVVGHTPQLTGEVLDLGHVICIDTFCFGSGWLTALDVRSGEIWQVDKRGNVRLDAGWDD